MDETVTWEELNAYVDGELPSDRASAVAEAIAADRGVARQAALLSRMKAGVAASAELPAALDIDRLQRLAAPRRERGLRSALAAAAVAALVAAGAAGLWLQAAAPAPDRLAEEAAGPARPAWLGQAIALHRALSAEPDRATRVRAPLAFPGLLPDLSSAKLSVGAVAPAEIDGLGSGSAVQYRGTRGCLVSLFALDSADAGLPESLQHDAEAGFDLYRWRVGAIDYLLLAEGMDGARLQSIARTVHEATRRFRPIDGPARERLADARRRSQPCRA